MIDEPLFPKVSPTYSATKSFRIKWKATGDRTTLEDKNKYFWIDGYPAKATGEFAVVAPELNFSFRGEATSTVAFLGSEVNGYYYMQGQPPPPELGTLPDLSLPNDPLSPEQ